MDATIRNLDEEAYRQLKARAAVEGKSVGEAMSEAIRLYVAQGRKRKTRSIRDIKVLDFGPGTERLSEQIDDVLYGTKHDRR
ncbi:MAG: ribbon-helix-helix protein, CopG family [Halobacteriales archaeon]|nr:ribbon-helix-helix protein, CopG family [Halobacteriales archaeon]